MKWLLALLLVGCAQTQRPHVVAVFPRCQIPPPPTVPEYDPTQAEYEALKDYAYQAYVQCADWTLKR